MTETPPASFLKRKISRADLVRTFESVTESRIMQSRRALWAMGLGLAALFVFQATQDVLVWDTDSPSYYAAAQGLRRGADIYDEASFQSLADSLFGRSEVVFPYLYPPLLAQLLIPLARLSIDGFFAVLWAVNVSLAFLALVLTARLLGLSAGRTPLPFLFLFALLPANSPLATTIHHGQINLLVLDAVLASLLFRRKDKPGPAGLFLAFAVLLKLSPAIFALPLPLSKKWRHLAAAAAWTAGLAAVSIFLSGPGPWLSFARFLFETTVRKPSSTFLLGFGTAIGNLSLKGFLHQLFEVFEWPQAAVLPAWGIAVAAVAAAVFLAVRRKRWEVDIGLQASVLFILAVLLAPLSWSHHYVVLIFPAAYLFHRILQERRLSFLLGLGAVVYLSFYHPIWVGFPFNQARTMAALFLVFFLLFYDRGSPSAADARPEAEP